MPLHTETQSRVETILRTHPEITALAQQHVSDAEAAVRVSEWASGLECGYEEQVICFSECDISAVRMSKEVIESYYTRIYNLLSLFYGKMRNVDV